MEATGSGDNIYGEDEKNTEKNKKIEWNNIIFGIFQLITFQIYYDHLWVESQSREWQQ